MSFFPWTDACKVWLWSSRKPLICTWSRTGCCRQVIATRNARAFRSTITLVAPRPTSRALPFDGDRVVVRRSIDELVERIDAGLGGALRDLEREVRRRTCDPLFLQHQRL